MSLFVGETRLAMRNPHWGWQWTEGSQLPVSSYPLFCAGPLSDLPSALNTTSLETATVQHEIHSIIPHCCNSSVDVLSWGTGEEDTGPLVATAQHRVDTGAFGSQGQESDCDTTRGRGRLATGEEDSWIHNYHILGEAAVVWVNVYFKDWWRQSDWSSIKEKDVG